MKNDFRWCFFITLPFAVVIMVLSANIQKWLYFSLDFPGRELSLFAIGTFIFVFGGWPFFKAAKGELVVV